MITTIMYDFLSEFISRFLSNFLDYFLLYCIHLYTYLKHRAKAISSDTDAYQEEMISLRDNLHLNNYQERITSTPRNLNRRTPENRESDHVD